MERLTAIPIRLAQGVALVALAWAIGGLPTQAEAQNRPTLGEILEAAANKKPDPNARPNKPGVKKRGLLARSNQFLHVERIKQNLQIALVLDGTESMDVDIDSVRQYLGSFVDGLRNAQPDSPNATLGISLVIYRDLDAPSGPVQMVLPQFSQDPDQVKSALQGVQTETGRPWFNERVDQGLAAAIEQLDWAPRDADAVSTRWVLLCGDAPPYPEGVDQRGYGNTELVQKANAKGIEIYSVLCNSGFNREGEENENLRETALRLRPKAADFFDQVASGTNGSFLDLWDESTVGDLLDKIPSKSVDYLRMAEITDDVISQFKRDQKTSTADAGGDPEQYGPVTMAILPPMPLQSMSFDPNVQAVQVAVELKSKFGTLPGMTIISPAEIESSFEDLKSMPEFEELSQQGPNAFVESRLIQRLADNLGAGYVLWGKMNEQNGQLRLASELYNALDGKLIEEASEQVAQENDLAMKNLAQFVAERLCRRTVPKLKEMQVDPYTIATFSSAYANREVAEQFRTEFSEDLRALRGVATAIHALGQAVEHLKKDQLEKARQPLAIAEAQLKVASQIDPDNPFVHLMLVSVYYNLAEMNDIDDYVTKQNQHLLKAYTLREKFDADHPARLEIEADYALLAKHDYPTAVELYSKLANDDPKNANYALRAHWMLAGIYLGDWGTNQEAPEVVDLESARHHILSILAFWPASSQAKFYRQAMENSGEGYTEVEVGGLQASRN
ncbi:Hypothetical protein PBC10988_23850 [Planctomycetales bacterium 10988]|nr:Hypothetical protein PBC10988_23850 [Planctomycetales bacterium 10988]